MSGLAPLVAPSFADSVAGLIGSNIATSISSAGIASGGSPLINAVNQETSKILPVSIPDVQSLINLTRRNVMKVEAYLEYMARLGFTETNATMLLNNTTRLIDIDALLRLYRRGELGPDEQANSKALIDRAFAIGIDIGDLPLYEKATLQHPNAQQLIEFLVHEIFDPDTRKIQGQDQDFPDLAIPEFAKIGFDEKYARDTWANHWRLPGTGEFFDMFHRLNPAQLPFKEDDIKALNIDPAGISFDLTALKKALKTADIMPFWRDKLTMIAYKPLSRIDIRRIDDTIGIPLDKLEYLNREIGLSPGNAHTMAVWTKMTNKLKDLRPLLESSDMTFDEATAELIKAGATPDEAKTQIDNIRLVVTRKRTAKNKDLTVSIIEQAYKIKLETRESTKTHLIALHLEPDEAEFYLKVWDKQLELDKLAKGTKEKNLTRVDIVNQYETGIIVRAVAGQQLVSIGYDANEAETILKLSDKKLANVKTKKGGTKVRTLTQADIKKEFDLDMITDLEAVRQMEDIGYSHDDAQTKVTTWKLAKEAKGVKK